MINKMIENNWCFNIYKLHEKTFVPLVSVKKKNCINLHLP